MDVVVHHAELVPGPDGYGLWKLAIEVTRGGETERGNHLIPAEAIEWRVAQFNIDPRAAIEMILAEPYMDPAESVEPDLLPTRSQARARQADRAAAALDGGAITWQDGAPPFTVGGEPAVVESGDGNPLDLILAETEIDDERLTVRRELLDQERAKLRARRERPIRTSSATELRRRLLPDPPPSDLVARVDAQPSELAERVLGKRIEALRRQNRADLDR